MNLIFKKTIKNSIIYKMNNNQMKFLKIIMKILVMIYWIKATNNNIKMILIKLKIKKKIKKIKTICKIQNKIIRNLIKKYIMKIKKI